MGSMREKGWGGRLGWWLGFGPCPTKEIENLFHFPNIFHNSYPN
jgi:hypothetical protein